MQHGAAAELLARSPLFGGLSGDLLRSIVERCALKQIGAGQVITIAGTPANSAYLVLEGEVALHDPRGRPLGETRDRGALLDEMAMFVETEHFPGAAAASNAWLLEIPRTVIGHLLIEQPHLAAQFAMNTKRNLARIAETLHRIDGMLLESSRTLEAVPAGRMDITPDGPDANGAARGPSPLEIAPLSASPSEASVRLAGRTAATGGAGRVNEQYGQEGGGASGNGHAGERINGSDREAADLLAQLNAAFSQEAQTLREPAHDRTAFPSHALRRSPAQTLPPNADPGSPTRDPGAGPGSMPASLARGSSTR